MLVGALVLLGACGGDDPGPAGSATAPSTTTRPIAPTTSAPADCDELTEEYLDVFFALGAGTPRDPDATEVELPVGELLTIDRAAAAAGCGDFVQVACSAYAELDAQGLEATNSDPPSAC